MLTLVTGGSASGKSEYAERLACQTDGKRVYIATMRPIDAECERRIQKHRLARQDRGFMTVERYFDLQGIALPEGTQTALLECMSNLVANELFEPEGAEECAVQSILAGVKRICEAVPQVVIVTNEVFSDGATYDPGTRRYICALGEANRALADMADRVVEVVYTIPLLHKGQKE